MDTDARPAPDLRRVDRRNLLVIHPELFVYNSPLDKDRRMKEDSFRNLLIGIALAGAVAIVAVTYFASQHEYFAVAEHRVHQTLQPSSVRANRAAMTQSLYEVTGAAHIN